MSKPRYKWWGYAKNVARSYPDLKRRRESLAGQERRELEAMEKALEETRAMDTGRDRAKIVELVFFRQSHTLGGASMAVYVSYETAEIYHREFLNLLGKYLFPDDYIKKPKK